MEEVTMDVYYEELVKLIDFLYDKEYDNIKKAAEVCADAIEKGGVVHVFGTGHSHGFSMEMKDRIGGLACIHQMDTADFVLKDKFTLSEFKDRDNIFERREGIIDQLYELYSINPNDVFIIISNSGINGMVIDMAITAKKNHHKIIVVTSFKHTMAEKSRHPSGSKLYEYGDVVIDNCGPQGDAFLDTGRLEKICSVSSILGAFIAQSLVIEICEFLKHKNFDLPVFKDESVKGGKEYNKALKEKYFGKV